LELLNHEDTVDVREVVGWLQADPVFSGEMLRVANERRALWTPHRDSQRTPGHRGLDFVKAVAITVGHRAHVKSAVKAPALHRCHSMACDILSQELATAHFMKGDEA
jgi:hypothetical protein